MRLRQIVRRRRDLRAGRVSEFTQLGSDAERARRRAEIAATGLLHADWYRARHLDVTDTAEHFAATGIYEGRAPNPYFDPDWYGRTYPDTRESRLPALLHYARYGWRMGYNPSPHFSLATYAALTGWAAEDGEPLARFFRDSVPGLVEAPVVDPARPDHIVDIGHEEIRASGLLHRDWYAVCHPDVDDADHFLTHGLAEGRRPNPYVDPTWYAARHPDVAAGGQNAVLHYLRHGWREGRDPSEAFSLAAYAELTGWTPRDGEPVARFLENGAPALTDEPPVDPARPDHITPVNATSLRRKEVGDSGLFHPDWYAARYPDVAGQGDPLDHFVARGLEEGRRPNPYLDPDWYHRTHPEAGASGPPAVLHYLRHGWQAGFDPSPRFSLDAYATLTGWTPKEGEPLARFLKDGAPALTDMPAIDAAHPGHALDVNALGLRRREVRESGLLHEAWYRGRYPDIAGLDDVLEHFVTRGLEEGRRPNPYLDPAWYHRAHPEAEASGLPAVLHYRRHGWREGHDPSPRFSLETYADLTGWTVEDGEPLARFLTEGVPALSEAPPVDPTQPDHTLDINEAGLRRREIRDGGLFDADWYAARYPDVAGFGDPLDHFVERGLDEGRRPNPYLDPAWYQETHPEAKTSDLPAVLHYMRHGWRAGFDPSPRFALDAYAALTNWTPEDGEPLARFLKDGVPALTDAPSIDPTQPDHTLDINETGLRRREIRDGGLFDADWYAARYPDIAGLDDVLDHFVTRGLEEGRRPNPYLDPIWYRETHPEAGSLPAVLHYMRHGWRAGFDPSPQFALEAYAALTGWTPEDGEPLARFLKDGVPALTDAPPIDPAQPDHTLDVNDRGLQRREVAGSGLFLEAWYRARYPDIAGLDDVLGHLLGDGREEDRWPNPYFDPAWYRQAYLGGETDDLLVHYLRRGWREGHDPSPRFSQSAYAALTGWTPEDGEPLARFLRDGVPALTREATVDPDDPGYFVHVGKESAAPVLAGNRLRHPLDHRPGDAGAVPGGRFTPNRLMLHWVVPDFLPGGGGHMTLFRMVRELGLRSHRQTIWLHGEGPHSHAEGAYDDILRHFLTLDAEVRHVEDTDMAHVEGDAAIATDWGSAWIVRGMGRVRRGFYFVQDDEAIHFPRGAEQLLADATYDMDLDAVCASPWLAGRMEARGRWARGFHLAADRDVYRPKPTQEPDPDWPRIAFYARVSTPRRAVELGLLALEALARRGRRFVVDFFGAAAPVEEAPYPFVSHGILSPAELADLYREATLGVVFSATNYSLVPGEMMACGLPVVELDVESTRAIYPGDAVTLAPIDPAGIANAVEALLDDPDRRRAQAEAALEWVSQFSWEDAADTLETALTDRLSELGHQALPPAAPREAPKASVVIPALNGGDLLLRVLERVKSQRLLAPFEILVIDSGSRDGTPERVAADERVRLHRIDPSEFGHGRTRNLGVEMTAGDYVAFLTQDALPLGDTWLADLVMAMDHHPEAGGAFGRHVAHEGADPFTARDIANHFRRFHVLPLAHSRDLDSERWASGETAWRQLMHYHSDNNAILRRGVWREVPLPDVDFGEDQLFARDILEAGYSKLYVPSAVVAHSHDHGLGEVRTRARTESFFFRSHFGYDLMPAGERAERLAAQDAADEAWGRAHGVPGEAITARRAINATRFEGFEEGRRMADRMTRDEATR